MRTLRLAAFLLLLQSAAVAQQPVTGLPPFGSFEQGGFDTINRQNLNVNFTVPLVSTPGRGTNFTYALVYDSLIWYPSGGAWARMTDANGNPTFGWKTTADGLLAPTLLSICITTVAILNRLPGMRRSGTTFTPTPKAQAPICCLVLSEFAVRLPRLEHSAQSGIRN